MDSSYIPKEIEEQAQQLWLKKQCFSVTEDLHKEKFYCLSMFPYPSGTLHMGHVRNYTLGDVIARYQRSLGKNVLQPIGWDAFGLPAENAAIKHGIPPAEWTRQNILSMKAQFMRLGNAYDWKREFATCDPEYYRWEQWFFLKLYEKGLVYKKNARVNWDPVDQTVLANEQVVDGKGWRSGAPVEQKEISQWFIKTTAYAEELLTGLDSLDGWPEQVKQMQRHWIGKSEGCEIHFTIPACTKTLKVYTTRADTLMGVTYLAISMHHPIAKKAAEKDAAIQTYLETQSGVRVAEADLATQEKTGIFSGFEAIHPFTKEPIPIWITNYVLMEYGTGAVMGVPAHDARDFEFAQHYHIPLKVILEGEHDYQKSAYTALGILKDSGDFSGLSSADATQAIVDALEKEGNGKRTLQYRLRDWGVSRQRYWGTPIPMIFCEYCGTVPVPESDLPVLLPEAVTITGHGSPLAQCESFINTKCPKCDHDALRETDTFDTFVESSWYYARFACKQQDNAMLDDRAKYWTPVDQYVGGIEHAVMHLLYARLFHKLMRDFGLVNSDEPFKALLTQGMVHKDGTKMSKSLGNIVDPNTLIDNYGADTARLFTMFAAPPEQSLEWSDAGVEGAYRFLKRLWSFIYQHHDRLKDMRSLYASTHPFPDHLTLSASLKNARLKLHQLLAQIQQDYERQQFNTVVSGCMKMLNELSTYVYNDEQDFAFLYEGTHIILRVLAPITPHITHHLWQTIGFDKLIIDAPWPKVDKNALKCDEAVFIVQVNGKLRGQFTADIHLPEETLLALAQESIAPHLKEQTILKSIVVAHRHLINFVVRA
ncbi:MAG: leucine--tRNA ligase [Legionellaceae bacterium]|nr:leucine--tRNA ligase [Legionellaceae bacterium]